MSSDVSHLFSIFGCTVSVFGKLCLCVIILCVFSLFVVGLQLRFKVSHCYSSLMNYLADPLGCPPLCGNFLTFT